MSLRESSRLLFLLLATLLCLLVRLHADDTRIMAITPDGIIINIGSEAGARAGMKSTVYPPIHVSGTSIENRITRFSITEVDRSSSEARITEKTSDVKNDYCIKFDQPLIPPPQKGTLWVATDPSDASVFINNRLIEDRMISLEVGVYEIKVTHSGYEDVIDRVTITADTLLQKSYELVQIRQQPKNPPVASLSPFPYQSQVFPPPDPSRIVIPENIREVLHQGIFDQTSRGDILLKIEDHYLFPVRGDIYFCFSFRLLSSAQTRGYADGIFLQYYTIRNDRIEKLEKEIYVPTGGTLIYGDRFYVGYPLPPGEYLLAMAIASSDQRHLGTAYYKVSLPDPLSGQFDISPICFVKAISQNPAPERQTAVHGDAFFFSVLKIEPKPDRNLSSDENLEVLFWIFNAKETSQGKYQINITYKVTRNGNPVIRWAQQTYEYPLVDQQLPLVPTVRIKTSAGYEIKQRRLERGDYTLVITATDTSTGLQATKEIDFTVY